jgi:IclR family transcriptional regulator, KDG regulon repressor
MSVRMFHQVDHDSSSRDHGSIASVVKALTILEFLGENGSGSLSELTEGTGYPKSTLFRLLATLTSEGFIERRERGEYAIAMKMWRIGARAIHHESLEAHRASALRTLSRVTSETTHFSVYDDGYAVYVDKVEGLHPVRAYTYIGGRSPAYASATGKALLARQSTEEIDRVARQAVRHTANTLGDPAEIAKEMEAVRRAGYAVNRGEWREPVWGVAASVFDHRGELAGAIGVSGPRERIEPNIPSLAELVCASATALTEGFGGRASSVAA